jgi:hypothetical protein
MPTLSIQLLLEAVVQAKQRLVTLVTQAQVQHFYPMQLLEVVVEEGVVLLTKLAYQVALAVVRVNM